MCSGAQGHSGTDLSLALFMELIYPQSTTSIPSTTSLTPVGPDEGGVQGGGDVLDAFQLDHTLVPPPVLLWDGREVQVPSWLGRTSPGSTCSWSSWPSLLQNTTTLSG